MLGNQVSRNIRFARAPDTVDLEGGPSFGECSGWSQTGCNVMWDFANDDIYFLELCLFSMVCRRTFLVLAADADAPRTPCDAVAYGTPGSTCDTAASLFATQKRSCATGVQEQCPALPAKRGAGLEVRAQRTHVPKTAISTASWARGQCCARGMERTVSTVSRLTMVDA